MSLATRCPHCSTIFKVVQDQLKMSGGWVRCGRCTQPFNALETLFDMAHEAPPPRNDPRQASAPESDPTPAHGPAADPSSATPPFSPRPPEPTFEPARAAADTAPAADESAAARLEEWADSDPASGQREAPGLTHFDLDLPPPPDRVEAAMASLIASAPSAALPTAPGLASMPPTASLPSTDEGDALDSRYLMSDPVEPRPAVTNRRQARKVPDFSDAKIPAEWHEDRLWNDTTQDHPVTEPMIGVLAPSAANTARAEHASPPPDAGAPEAPATSRPVPLESESPPPSRRRKIGEKVTDTAPGFIRQADRKALWRRPWMRGLLAGLSLALTVLLAAQLAIHHRDALAEKAPALTPALQLWCEQAGCRLGPVHDIEALQVESIAMIRASSEGPDVYRLVLNVRNHASQPRAWPSVDLTLTDANGGVLGRRLFDTRQAVLPAVGKTPARALPPAVPAGTVTTVQWRLQAPDLQLASYTIELFYP